MEDRTAALRDAQAQLVQSEKMSSLGKLAASVAHEINNPLAGILTYAKLLIRMHEEGEMTEKARETCVRNLRLVQRETERCSAIVRNLLDFARQRPPSLKEVDVSAVVEEALSLLAHRLMMQNVTLEKHLPPMPLVMADFGQMRQAFVNIALNACEAMNEGGALDGDARAARDQFVEITFRDTGPGIPPEHLVADPRSLLHDEGEGDGPRPVGGLRHHRAPRRQARRPEPGRPGDDGGHPAARIGRRRARAAGRRPRRRRDMHVDVYLLVDRRGGGGRGPAGAAARGRPSGCSTSRRACGTATSGRSTRSTRAASSTRRRAS